MGDGSGHFVECFVFWGEELGGCGSDLSEMTSYDVEEVFEYMNRVCVGMGMAGQVATWWSWWGGEWYDR